MNTKYTEQNCYVMSCPSCHVFINMSGTSLIRNEKVKPYKCGAQSKARKGRQIVRHEIKH